MGSNEDGGSWRALLVVAALAGALVGMLRQHSVQDHRAVLTKPAAEPSYRDGSPRFLFIGGSFTSINDLPGTFARVARSLGQRPGVGMYAPGGQTFAGHLKDPELAKRLASREWDFVVLQEQSQKAAFDLAQVEAETVGPAQRLIDLIHASHPAAKAVFYETWGRKTGDQENCGALPDVCTYEGMQARVDKTYTLLVHRSSGTLAPVGVAWAKVRANHPEVELYASDGIHPSPSGTYLAACVFYAVLYRKPSAGADVLGLDKEEAALLQTAADGTVLGR